MNVQAIMRHTVTTVLTFTGKPDDGTRKAMLAAGFLFDGKSKQWYRREENSGLVDEEQVLLDIGVAA
jgi:hypothetical protein